MAQWLMEGCFRIYVRSGTEIREAARVKDNYAKQYKNTERGASTRPAARIYYQRGIGARARRLHRQGIRRRLARRALRRRRPQPTEPLRRLRRQGAALHQHAAPHRREERRGDGRRPVGGRSRSSSGSAASTRARSTSTPSRRNRPGCIIVGTATVEAPSHPAIGAVANQILASFEKAFERGFINSDLKPDPLARRTRQHGRRHHDRHRHPRPPRRAGSRAAGLHEVDDSRDLPIGRIRRKPA